MEEFVFEMIDCRGWGKGCILYLGCILEILVICTFFASAVLMGHGFRISALGEQIRLVE